MRYLYVFKIILKARNRSKDYNDDMFRLKYERTINELDEAKRRLVSQHEDDLEQMMMIKKQMEKKLNEAYEEVDEQKRDSAQWKNKYKKVQVRIVFQEIVLN